jgi:hypothetical protein
MIFAVEVVSFNNSPCYIQTFSKNTLGLTFNDTVLTAEDIKRRIKLEDNELVRIWKEMVVI